MIHRKNFLIHPFILVSLFALLIAGCTKEKDDETQGDNDLQGTPVIITGTLDVSAAQATGVLAISSDNHFKQAEISGSQFSIELDNGKPWGLVFLNEAEQPLGLLSLGDGIDALPMHYVSPAINNIELGTISFNETAFTASLNPLGNSIPLTSEQIQIVASMDDYMVALLKNPDVNGNGKIDVLEGKIFSLSVLYFIKPGNFKVPELKPTLNTGTLIEGYRLVLTVQDASYPEKIYFTGPSGSPLTNSPSESVLSFDNARVYNTKYLFDLSGSASYIPVEGAYKIIYGSSTLTFNLPDQSYVNTNIVYPWPAVKLNENGTLNKVDWTYMHPAGAVSFDISALLRSIMVQLGGNGPECKAIPNQNGLYGSDHLPVTSTSHTFACQNIVWLNSMPLPGDDFVERLMMTYEDHYGASYVVMYEKTY